MTRNSNVSAVDAGVIFYLHSKGKSARTIAAEVKRHVSTVTKVLARGLDHYNGKREPRKKRRESLPLKKRRNRICKLVHMVRHKRNSVTGDMEIVGRPFGTCPAIRQKLATEGTFVSNSTILRDTRARGIRVKKRPKVGQVSVVKNQNRVIASREFLRISPEDCIFSDESWSNTNDNTNARELVPKGQTPTPKLHARQPTVKLMMWAAIGVGYKSRLVLFERKGDEKATVDADSYCRRCGPTIRQALNRKPGLKFVQDNARPHLKLGRILAGQGYTVLKWPPYSPDLNPIETVWADLKRRVSAKYPRSTEELKAATLAAWAEIPQSTIDNHVRSFTARLNRCIERDGVST